MTTGYSTMTMQQAQEEIRVMQRAMKKLKTDPEAVREFLVSAGILDKDGKRLAAHYR